MKLIFSVLSLHLTLKYMSLAKKMAVAQNLSIKLFSFLVSQKGMSYAVLSLLASCKYNEKGDGRKDDCMTDGVCRWRAYFRGDQVKLFCFVKLFVLLSVAKDGYSASSNYNGKSILALRLAKHA